jgi:lysine N6-hydroxylase
MNELFTPSYSEYFFKLSSEIKFELLEKQALASDGISLHLLKSIYQKLYMLEFLENRGRFFCLLPNHQLTTMCLDSEAQILVLSEKTTCRKKSISADITILCTGYQWEFPKYLSALTQRIPLMNGHFCVNNDFSILWDGPKENRIYVQNAARHAYGIADPNLSLMAWRSAKIINSLVDTKIYDIEHESTAVDWNKLFVMENEEWRHVCNA